MHGCIGLGCSGGDGGAGCHAKSHGISISLPLSLSLSLSPPPPPPPPPPRSPWLLDSSRRAVYSSHSIVLSITRVADSSPAAAPAAASFYGEGRRAAAAIGHQPARKCDGRAVGHRAQPISARVGGAAWTPPPRRASCLPAACCERLVAAARLVGTCSARRQANH